MIESHKLSSPITQILGIAIGLIFLLIFSIPLLLKLPKGGTLNFFILILFLILAFITFYLTAARITIADRIITVNGLFKKEKKYNISSVCIKRIYFNVCIIKFNETERTYYLANIRDYLNSDYEKYIKEKFNIKTCL